MDGWRGTRIAHTRGMGAVNNLPPGYLVGGLGLGGMLMLAGLALFVFNPRNPMTGKKIRR